MENQEPTEVKEIAEPLMLNFSGMHKTTTLYIPANQVNDMAVVLNEFLQSKGIESWVVVKETKTNLSELPATENITDLK